MKTERRSFLKKSCSACGCLGAMLLLDGPSWADQKTKQNFKQQLDQFQAFASAWTTNLMRVMDKELDPKTRTTILEACGKTCAELHSTPLIKAYKGKLDDFLVKMKELWVKSYEHDAKKGRLRLVGGFSSCVCPIHPASGTKSFCSCSNGHIKHLFSSVIGKPVEIQLIDSILRGGKSCCWAITYNPA